MSDQPNPRTALSLPPTMADARTRGAVPPEIEPLLHRADSKRYAVGEELGRGGCGVVHRAADRDLCRAVALKAMLGEEGPGLFAREAQLTAQLEHPNIVPVHDVGLTEDRRIFFTMKVVEGRSFAEVLRERRPLRPTLEILLRACDAAAFAHSKGVVHRDLKPANVMVGEFGEVLVMDWGLAAVADLPDAAPSDRVEVKALGHSMDGAVVGTPSYMPPEQARGERVDARADVYALGAMLYEMLAGAPPVTGSTIMDVLRKAQAGDIGPPPKSAPPELAAIAMKALSKDPGDRYATAREFQEDLKRYLEGREVSARRDSTPVRVLKWIKRNPIPCAAAAAALAALLGGVLVTRLQISAKEATEQAKRRAEATAKAEALRRDASRTLASATTIEALLGADEKVRAAQDLLEPFGGTETPLRYDVNRRLGGLALGSGNYMLARMAFSVCRSIDATREDFDRLVTDVEEAESRRRGKYVHDALDEMRAGLSRPNRKSDALMDDYVFEVVGYRDERTVRLIAEALEPLREKAKREGRAAAWSQPEHDVMHFSFEVLGRLGLESSVAPLAGMMEALWDHACAVECGLALCNTRSASANAPLEEARDRLGINSPEWESIAARFGRVPGAGKWAQPRTAFEFLKRGLARKDKNDLAGAIEDFTRGLALDPRDTALLNNRGLTRHLAGDAAGAIEDFGKIIELTPNDSAAHANRGAVRQSRGDLKGAEEDYSRAIKLDPGDATSYGNRGVVREALGDLDGAIEDYGRAIELDPNDAGGYNNRGLARAAKGDLDGALKDYDRAVERDPRSVNARINRGAARQLLGDLNGAIEDYNRAIQLDPTAAKAFDHRGVARHHAGNLDGAIEDYGRAIALAPREPHAYKVRGLARRAKGDPAGAVSDWERFLELAPEDPEAAAVREEIRKARAELKQDY